MAASRTHGPLGVVSVACIVSFALCAPRASEGATIRVPADAPTIQQAINAAVNGDTVLVSPGTYVEVINFSGKAIVVASEQGPDTTIIDAAGAGSVVTFRSGETRAATLSGFTVRGGLNGFSGGGIYIASSSPTIRGNIITENRSCTGVGIYSSFSSPLIQGNTITRNAIYGCTGGWGIGIYVGGNTAAEIIGNVISDNTGEASSGGGVALFAAGNAVLIGNVIARNATAGAAGCGWGGGVAIANFVQATIVNNLIVGNSACVGGAFYWLGSTGSTVLVNNTIADNVANSAPGLYVTGVDARNKLHNNIITAQSGPALFCENAASVTPPVLNSNDLFNAQGPAYGGTCADQTGLDGNISGDPLFVDALAGDYRVPLSSPAIDAGNNSAPHIQPTDIAGNPRIVGATSNSPDRIDMGAFEYLNYAPNADAGADQTVTAGADCCATVTLNGSGIDPDGDTVTFTWTGPFGTATGPSVTLLLPAGAHVVTLTTSDGRGGFASDSVLVTVLDATPPSINALTATPPVLSHSNHEMVPVVVSVSALDSCGGTVSCRIASVTSNEPTTGLGGGDIGPDWEITGSLTLKLRAERWNKGNGRVYTISVECSDPSGNHSISTVTVTVPRR